MTALKDVIDGRGFTRPSEIIGNILTHSKLGHEYVILDIVWMGDQDLWGFLHRRCECDDALIVRPLSYLFGKRSNGTRRYIEYEDYAQFSDEE